MNDLMKLKQFSLDLFDFEYVEVHFTVLLKAVLLG